jgi:general secretion pathway protein B
VSLILDALNRSRQDVGDIPGLESQHQLGTESSPGTSRWWALALLIALGVIALLLYQRGEQAVVAPETVIVAESGPAAPTPAPKPKVMATPVPQKVVPPVPASPKPRLPGAKITPSKPQANAEVTALYGNKSAPAAPALPEPGPAPAGKGEQQAASAPAVEQKTVSEQPVDIDAMVAQAHSELENAQLDEHPAPFLSALSQQTKDGIPTIYYQRHDYSGRPGQSEVVLNGKVVKDGGRTSAGVQVDEILPGSVVLSFQGTQFRLRALNSWVNL